MTSGSAQTSAAAAARRPLDEVALEREEDAPSRALDPRVHPDALTRRAAIALARTATVRFDLSDLQPPAFGATAEQGMWSIFQRFLADPRDPAATARRLERAARAAWDCQRAIGARC